MFSNWSQFCQKVAYDRLPLSIGPLIVNGYSIGCPTTKANQSALFISDVLTIRTAWYMQLLYNSGVFFIYLKLLIHSYSFLRAVCNADVLKCLICIRHHDNWLIENIVFDLLNNARICFHTVSYEHITPAFIALHWLPIKERCDFKILLSTYKCFNGLAPAYLEELLHKRPDCGSCRDNDNLLIVPKLNRVTFGGLHLREQPLTSGIVYLLFYVRAKLLTFLNLG